MGKTSTATLFDDKALAAAGPIDSMKLALKLQEIRRMLEFPFSGTDGYGNAEAAASAIDELIAGEADLSLDLDPYYAIARPGSPAVQMPLYKIARELEDAIDATEETGGELTPQAEVLLDKWAARWEQKCESVALYIRNLLVESDAVKTEADRLSQRARSKKRAAESLKDYLLGNMIRMECGRVETPRVVVRVQRNGQPSISWTKDTDDLPEAFARTTVTVSPDIKAAQAELKAGATLPDGFKVEHGCHLRIS